MICSHLLARQRALGITAHFAEIGTFEDRFFIAMALSLAEAELALGIDTFGWPEADVANRFHGHCARHSLTSDRYRTLRAN